MKLSVSVLFLFWPGEGGAGLHLAALTGAGDRPPLPCLLQVSVMEPSSAPSSLLSSWVSRLVTCGEERTTMDWETSKERLISRTRIILSVRRLPRLGEGDLVSRQTLLTQVLA